MYSLLSCISLYSYIKPQRYPCRGLHRYVVYPYIPTSNRNYRENGWKHDTVVYPYIPTSNRNVEVDVSPSSAVVYPYIPTSNRNTRKAAKWPQWLYILIFLHQTATHFTVFYTISSVVYPYIPTSNRNGCPGGRFYPWVVYPYIPTSNRNPFILRQFLFQLYILIFLHQTATAPLSICRMYSCISLYSYIKPQPHG